MRYDFTGMRRAGYTDQQIVDALKAREPYDFDGMMKAGYSATAIVDAFAARAPKIDLVSGDALKGLVPPGVMETKPLPGGRDISTAPVLSAPNESVFRSNIKPVNYLLGVPRALASAGNQLLSGIAGLTGIGEEPLRRQAIAIKNAAPEGMAAVEQGAGSMLAAAPAALINPALGAAAGGLMVAGPAYSEARKAGYDKAMAALYAGGHGAIEAATELVPLRILFGQGGRAVERVLKAAAPEITGEQIATLAQDALQWAATRPEATFKDYLRERPEAAKQTLLATLGGLGAAGPVLSLAQKAAPRKTDTAPSGYVPQQDAANTLAIQTPKPIANEIVAKRPARRSVPAQVESRDEYAGRAEYDEAPREIEPAEAYTPEAPKFDARTYEEWAPRSITPDVVERVAATRQSGEAKPAAMYSGGGDVFGGQEHRGASTHEQVVEQARAMLGERAADALFASGVIRTVKTPAELDMDGIRAGAGDIIHGVTSPDGRVTVVLDSVSRDMIPGVLNHEFFHAAVKNHLGDRPYAALMNRMASLRSRAESARRDGVSSGKWWEAALDAIPAGTPESAMNEEMAAYAIEQWRNGTDMPTGVRKWVMDFMTALRLAIIKRMPNGKLGAWAMANLKPHDLAELAIKAMRRVDTVATPAGEQPMFSKRSAEPDYDELAKKFSYAFTQQVSAKLRVDTERAMAEARDLFEQARGGTVSHETQESEADRLANLLGWSREGIMEVLSSRQTPEGFRPTDVMGAGLAIARVHAVQLQKASDTESFVGALSELMTLMMAIRTMPSEAGRLLGHYGWLQRKGGYLGAAGGPAMGKASSQGTPTVDFALAKQDAKEAVDAAKGLLSPGQDISQLNELLRKRADSENRAADLEQEAELTSKEIDAAKKALDDARRRRDAAREKLTKANQELAKVGWDKTADVWIKAKEYEREAAEIEPEILAAKKALDDARRRRDAAREKLTKANQELAKVGWDKTADVLKKAEEYRREADSTEAEIPVAEKALRQARAKRDAAYYEMVAARQELRNINRLADSAETSLGKLRGEEAESKAQTRGAKTRLKSAVGGMFTNEVMTRALGGKRGVEAIMRAIKEQGNDLNVNLLLQELNRIVDGIVMRDKVKKTPINKFLNAVMELFSLQIIIGWYTYEVNVLSNLANTIYDLGFIHPVRNIGKGGTLGAYRAFADGKLLADIWALAKYNAYTEMPGHRIAHLLAQKDPTLIALMRGGEDVKYRDTRHGYLPGKFGDKVPLGAVARTAAYVPLGVQDSVFKTVVYRFELARQQAAGEPQDIQAAIDLSDKLTFASPSEFGAVMADLGDRWPVIKPFGFLFIRTMTNLLRRAVEITPGLNLLVDSEKIYHGSEIDRRDVAARMLVGTAVMAMLWPLIGDDEEDRHITGYAPTDRYRRALFFLDRDQLAVRIGDESFSFYRYSPVSDFIGLVASIKKSVANLQEGESWEATKEMLSGFTQAVLTKHLMKNVAELFDFVMLASRYNEPSEEAVDRDNYKAPGPGEVAERAVGNFAMSALIPNMFAQIGDFTDEHKRKARTLEDDYMRRIPWLRQELPEFLDLRGDALDNPRYLNPLSTTVRHAPRDEVARWQLKLGQGLEPDPIRLRNLPRDVRKELLQQRWDWITRAYEASKGEPVEIQLMYLRKVKKVWARSVTHAILEHQ